jgi:hypothetical protein
MTFEQRSVCSISSQSPVSLTRKDSIMASAFSHAFVAVALGSAYARHSMPWHSWVLSITCSILPDADVMGFAVRYRVGGLVPTCCLLDNEWTRRMAVSIPHHRSLSPWKPLFT